ncbi:uncharacterized protein LOC128310004 [Anopheles moucheti]|uniref:uncharacterized protein LOC128310004 n=1 Tax=Anopheles moucheti TaxID=186751 RepID=UPI0022F05247|nr:uncharacterized protein LOC128310004 [Anopheles moucheti]
MIALRTVCQFSRVNSITRHITTNVVRHAEAAVASSGAEKLTIPVPEGTDKPADPKLVSIVDSIAKLNLLEVSELSTLLKRKLNLPDTAMMPAGFGAFAGGAAPAAVEEEEAAPKVVKTTFKVKLVKFDEKQKVALIKEVKNLLEGMNLVQAKKFVESAPTVVKDDIPKDEAEKLKEAFTKVGAVIEIE